MWPAIIAGAVAIWLITQSSLLAATLPYAAAAWPAVRSAFWLRATDPWRERAHACFLFYLATGAWRAAAAGLTSLLLLATLAAVRGRQPDGDAFLAFTALLCGLAIATLLGVTGLFVALLKRTPVFVAPKLYARCRGDWALVGLTPPHKQFNHGIFIVATSIVLPIVALGGGIAIAGASWQNPNDAPQTLQLVGLFVAAAGPVVSIPLYAYCSHRVLSASEQDCWLDILLDRWHAERGQ